jgi:hypothetical protein
MSPEVEAIVREFAGREVAAPPWDCDPLGPDAVCRMWVKVGASLGMPARDLPRKLADDTHVLYRAEVKRLRAS